MSINVMWNRSGALDALSAFVGGYGRQNQQTQAQQAQMDYTADVANNAAMERGLSNLIGPTLQLGTAYLGANAAGLPADEARGAAIASVMPRSVAASIMGRQEMGRDLEYNDARYEQDFKRTFGFPSSEASSVGETHFSRLDPAMQQQVLSTYDLTPESFATLPQADQSRIYGRMSRDFVSSQQARQEAQVKMQVIEQARAADEARSMRAFGDLEIAEGLNTGKMQITNPIWADKWSRLNSSLEGMTDDPSIAGDPRLVSAFQAHGNAGRMSMIKAMRNAGVIQPKLTAQDMAEQATVRVNGRVLLPHGKNMEKILDLGPAQKQVEYPEGQGVGEVWEPPNFPGVLLTRKPTGEVTKVVDGGGKQVGPKDYFELREKIRDSLTTEPDDDGNVTEPSEDQIDAEMDRTMGGYERRFGNPNERRGETPPATPSAPPAEKPPATGSWLRKLLTGKQTPPAGAAPPAAKPAATPTGGKRLAIPKIKNYLDYDEEKGVLGIYNHKTKSWRYIPGKDDVSVDTILEMDTAVRDGLRRPVKDPKTGKAEWVEPTDAEVSAALEKKIDAAIEMSQKYKRKRGKSAANGDDAKFRKAYGAIVEKRKGMGMPLNPDPDAPEHKYDYRAAWKAGKLDVDAQGHFPSQFKADDHPNRFVDGKDTKAGGPTTQPAAQPKKPLITGERATEISREMAAIAKQYPGAKGAPEHVKRRYYNLKKELEALTRG